MANFKDYPQGGQNNYGGQAQVQQPMYNQPSQQEMQAAAPQMNGGYQGQGGYAQPQNMGQPSMPQQQAVMQQPVQQAPVQGPHGTRVTRIFMNPNWHPGDKSWIASVDITTDAKLYLNNISAIQGQNGIFLRYPSHPRVRNGQTVMNGQYPVRNPYYLPLVDKNTGYNGVALMLQKAMPLINAVMQQGGTVAENPQDVYHASRFTRSTMQNSSSVAYGTIVSEGIAVQVNGIFVNPVYDEAGNISLRLNFPSSARMRNGQPVKGQDGRPVYTNWVLPAKESSEDILQVVGTAVNEALAKAAAQQPAQQQAVMQQPAAQQPQQNAAPGYQPGNMPF